MGASPVGKPTVEMIAKGLKAADDAQEIADMMVDRLNAAALSNGTVASLLDGIPPLVSAGLELLRRANPGIHEVQLRKKYAEFLRAHATTLTKR